ncbi:MAG: phosphoribosylformylglycinamidine synthase [Treponema sp. CETP13]|nr:MAG: phosphoribosylformylglycinamidine synthase [Treponema sp. CETP13]
MTMFRIYVERKNGFKNEASRILSEINGFLGIADVTAVRYLNRYDVENVTNEVAQAAAKKIFSEPQSDIFSTEAPEISENETVIAWEFLPGQYDQRADSAEQCLSLLRADFAASSITGTEKPIVKCAKLVILKGAVSASDVEKIKSYLLNPVDSRPASLDIPQTLQMQTVRPDDIPVLEGFITYDTDKLSSIRKNMGLAMDQADIEFLQQYFIKEDRDPTETEIRVLDTYWSDHCRHTTFNTILNQIEIDEGELSDPIVNSMQDYANMRTELYADREKPVCLMDMACIGAKYLKKHGKLDDIEISEEINACSIYIDVHYTDDTTERWLLMFKNETHNHPTEIEPFGGAATCIGGAIRDPLSGRSWVYQALRVTGCADPTVPLEKTRHGKLPQIKLTREAAQGFSSYGNQIGLTTGQVAEIYDPGYVAKRMELGAVIAAAPADMVMREEPEVGDCIVLVGGGTGRDGIGGATGSSKAHTEKSVTTAAAEVQKGNAVEERKIQRLFRNKEVSRMIRRCNDFGAGGVSVAVGELAPGLLINLDKVPKKYEGLNGTELAISESQERMAIVVREKDVDKLFAAAAQENLNASLIAKVTDTNRLVLTWRGKTIVDIDRDFLDTAGASREASAHISSPVKKDSPLLRPLQSVQNALQTEKTARSAPSVITKKAWLANISDLATCSQRGLAEQFDGSIGASSVLFPMGGKYQGTPECGCAAKIPVMFPKETTTASLMTFGYDPKITTWSPWHGGQFSVLSSLAKITALGGNPETCRLTFQEFFERTSTDPDTWGAPTAAMLGALSAQKEMGTAAIGGKDSMSGTFEDIHVPPTIVSFAVATEEAKTVRSGCLTEANKQLYVIYMPLKNTLAPDFTAFKENAALIYALNKQNKISAMYPVGAGGIAEAITKMALGNRIGVSLTTSSLNKFLVSDLNADLRTVSDQSLFLPLYGSIIVETSENLTQTHAIKIGTTTNNSVISVNETTIDLCEIEKAWEAPLAKVFPPQSNKNTETSIPSFAQMPHKSVEQAQKSFVAKTNSSSKTAPTVLLPVFPGTNCEFDMARAFALAGANTKIVVFRNNTPQALASSLDQLQKELSTAQILALSGGFSAGDEPDGSGKFIANVLREHAIADEIMKLIEQRDGLILGICNGFQALIKTGLVPYGKIMEPSEEMPTLTFNTVGRHISRMVQTRLTSAISPWAQNESVLEGTHTVAISHGEGRIICGDSLAKDLFNKGQVFTQYIDSNGNPALTEPANPNGSAFSIEGLTSPNGHVLGKMGHSERTITKEAKNNLIKNTIGNRNQDIFSAGVNYFL